MRLAMMMMTIGVLARSAHADLGDQLFKLLPKDGAFCDTFGRSVAISGASAIVGAERDDDNGNQSGSAYLFDTTTGGQIAKLLPNDGGPHQWFGFSVAISGTTAVVGAPLDDDNGDDSGSAYLFGTATQIAKLLPDDGAAGDWFGRSVAISGAIAIVGADLDDDSGSAYLFDTTTGRQIAKLLANDGAGGDRFGFSVAIRGTLAIVGARFDDDNGDNSGSAYLFDITTGEQLFKLLPNDGAASDEFGYSVAISGTTAIVGAFADDDNGPYSGSAYLFDITTGEQLFKLLPSDGAANDLFGYSVAISGTTAIVGADWHDENGPFSGSAYLFDTNTGQQLFKLLPNDGAAYDLFGFSVAISGAIAIVGAWHHDDNGEHSGSAYLFDITTGEQLFKLLPNDGAAFDEFGFSVAISGAIAIVGARFDDDNGNNSGSAYLFDTTTGQQIAKLLAVDGAADDRFGLSVAISDSTAIAGALLDDDNGDNSGSAYLFDAAGTPGKCPWDLDGSGAVGILDLLALLAAWGTDPGGPPDFDGNGTVGILDLLTLLANWGECP